MKTQQIHVARELPPNHCAAAEAQGCRRHATSGANFSSHDRAHDRAAGRQQRCRLGRPTARVGPNQMPSMGALDVAVDPEPTDRAEELKPTIPSLPQLPTIVATVTPRWWASLSAGRRRRLACSHSRQNRMLLNYQDKYNCIMVLVPHGRRASGRNS